MRPSTIIAIAAGLLAVSSCSKELNDQDRAHASGAPPSEAISGPLKVAYFTDATEPPLDRKKDVFCNFSYGAGIILVATPTTGTAIIDGRRITMAVTRKDGNYPVLSGGGYTASITSGTTFEKSIADTAAKLSIKGPRGEGVFDLGLWTCFPHTAHKKASEQA